MGRDTQILTGGVLGAVIALLGVGTVFYHIVEKLSWVDSLYFTVITLTTVGYGDISPQTDLGKLFTILYVVIGIGIFAFFIDALTKQRAKNNENRRRKRIKKN